MMVLFRKAFTHSVCVCVCVWSLVELFSSVSLSEQHVYSCRCAFVWATEDSLQAFLCESQSDFLIHRFV